MKFNKLTYLLAGAVMLGLGSCAHFLDIPTDTRVELQNPEQLRMLMNSAYPQHNYMWICELHSDNVEDNNSSDEDGVRYNLSSYSRGDDEMFRFEPCVSSSASDSPYGTWEGFYNSIATCNQVLEAADRMSADESNNKILLNAVRGEALMLRSYCHFILAQIFCMPYGGPEKSKEFLGIPYSTKPETTVKPHYARPDLKETYDCIVKDFEDGYKLINNTIYVQKKYHFNTTAANAYGARLFLVMRQYNKAFNYANMALGAPSMKDVTIANTSLRTDPTPYISDVYSKLGKFYYLTDFGYYQNSIERECNFLLYPTYSVARRHIGGGCRYSNIRNALNATIHGASPAWETFSWTSRGGGGTSFVMHPSFNGCCFINGKSDYGIWSGVNLQEFFEYTDKVAGIGYCHITRREFTGEEALFVRAEAELFLGDTNAALADIDAWEKNRRNCPGSKGMESYYKDYTLDNINKFYVTNLPEDRNQTKGAKNGYGIAKEIHIDQICPVSDATVGFASVEGMLQCIQHLRRIEFVQTGMRWFDIKRLGLEYSHYQGKDNIEYHLDIEDPRKAVQIPADVVAAGFLANPSKEVITIENNSEKVVPLN